MKTGNCTWEIWTLRSQGWDIVKAPSNGPGCGLRVSWRVGIGLCLIFRAVRRMRLFRRFIIARLPKCKVKERVRHIVWLLLEEASQVVWYGLLSLEHIYESLPIFVSDLSQRETRPGMHQLFTYIWFFSYEHRLINILIVLLKLFSSMYNARSHGHHGIQIPDSQDTNELHQTPPSQALPLLLRPLLNCNRSKTSF